MFVFTKISNHGSSHAINARIVIGLAEIVRLTELTQIQKQNIMTLLYETSKDLFQACEAAEIIMQEIQGIESRRSQQQHNVESVLSLDKAKIFLKCSKDSFKHVSVIMGIIFNNDPKSFEGGNFTKIRKELIVTADALILSILDIYSEWYETLSALRNGDEHPKSMGSFLVNYSWDKGYAKRPYFAKEFNPDKIKADIPIDQFLFMSLEHLLPFCEMVILSSLLEFLPETVAIIEIPEKERDPKCPKRFRVGLTAEEDFQWQQNCERLINKLHQVIITNQSVH